MEHYPRVGHPPIQGLTPDCDRTKCDKQGHFLGEESNPGVEVKHREAALSPPQIFIEYPPPIWLLKVTLLQIPLMHGMAQVVTIGARSQIHSFSLSPPKWTLESLVQSVFLNTP